MRARDISIIIPYTKDGKILLQDRRSMSKYGEQWGYWGGGIEPGENAEQAARRELGEELGVKAKKFEYIGDVNRVCRRTKSPIEDVQLNCRIFMLKTLDDLSQFHVQEGDGAEFFTVLQARKLTMAPGIDYEILDLVDKFLKHR